MEIKQKGIWSCNKCGQKKETSNGYCVECGPTQTTPVDDTAKKEAGVKIEE